MVMSRVNSKYKFVTEQIIERKRKVGKTRIAFHFRLILDPGEKTFIIKKIAK